MQPFKSLLIFGINESLRDSDYYAHYISLLQSFGAWINKKTKTVRISQFSKLLIAIQKSIGRGILNTNKLEFSTVYITSGPKLRYESYYRRNLFSTLLFFPFNKLRLVVIISTILLSNCTLSYKNLEKASQKAVSDCRKLSDNKQQMCIGIVNKRLAYYKFYTIRKEVLLDSLDKFNQQLKSQFRYMKKEYDLSDKLLNSKYLKIKKQYNWNKQKYKAIVKNDRFVTRKINRSFTDIPNLVKQNNIYTQLICKVRDMGKVDCVMLIDILALYDIEMNNIIISDIKRLYDLFEIDVRKEILIECGLGGWFGEDLTSEQNINDMMDFINNLESNNETQEAFQDACLNLRPILNQNSSLINNGYGFSGVTGFDNLGLCVLGELNTDQTYEESMEILNNIELQCITSIGQSLMQGGSSETEDDLDDQTGTDDTNDQTDTSDTDDQSNSNSTDDKKATGTQEITDNGDGTEHVIERDAEGNIVEEYDQPRSVTWDKIVTTYYDDGSTYRVGTNSDGSQTHNLTQDTTVYWQIDIDTDGNLTCSSRGNLPAPCSEYCYEETCETCINFKLFKDFLEMECMGANVGNYLCESYGMKSSCCNNPNTYPADPWVLLPNPEGDFLCSGNFSADLVMDRCMNYCKFADHEDCFNNCMSMLNYGILDYSLMDDVCLYADYEYCIEDRNEVPEIIGSTGPFPQPKLNFAAKHILIPNIRNQIIEIEEHNNFEFKLELESIKELIDPRNQGQIKFKDPVNDDFN